MPFVSFVVPTIWRRSLVMALDSIYSQSDLDLETIVAIDGSATADALTGDGLISEIPDYRQIHFLKTRVSGSAGLVRNEGVNACTGEWIAFLDDDDYLGLQYVEHLRQHAEDYPWAEVVIFRMKDPRFGVLPPPEGILQHGTVGISFAVKRDLMQKHEFVKEDRAEFKNEDWELISDLQRAGSRIFLSPYTDYYVRDTARI